MILIDLFENADIRIFTTVFSLLSYLQMLDIFIYFIDLASYSLFQTISWDVLEVLDVVGVNVICIFIVYLFNLLLLLWINRRFVPAVHSRLCLFESRYILDGFVFDSLSFASVPLSHIFETLFKKFFSDWRCFL